MSYTTAEGRTRILADLAQAADELALSLALLGEAFDTLDDAGAERLEEQLFRPVQLAYGRAQRLHAEFAARSGLPGRTFAPGSAGAASQGAKALVERAVAAAGAADNVIAELQDSMVPIEAGDPELRAALAEVRELVGAVPARGRDFARTFGR